MNTRSGLSDEDKKEIFQSNCEAFQDGYIEEKEFREQLGLLGYNATDIEEYVQFYRPKPPEDDGDL